MCECVCVNTYPYAAEAAEFGAVWAESSIPQLLHTDEAAKHLRYALQQTQTHTLRNVLVTHTHDFKDALMYVRTHKLSSQH